MGDAGAATSELARAPQIEELPCRSRVISSELF